MVLPRKLARVNRVMTNRVGVRLVGRIAGLTVVRHRGRVSGRIYETPVAVFDRAEGYRVVLSYGRQTDWLRNLDAAGDGQLQVDGKWLNIVSTNVVHDAHGLGMPPLIRPLLRLLKITDFVDLRTADPATC